MSHTFWLTGLSGAGKSTIANKVKEEAEKHNLNLPIYLLDGDVLRTGLCSDLGFSKDHRHENLRRAASVAAILNEANVLVIAAFITPYESDREMIRTLIGKHRTSIVHVATPLEVCEARDVKGMYKKARAGDIPLFTGVSDPFESPTNPNLVLTTNGSNDTAESIRATAADFLSFILSVKI